MRLREEKVKKTPPNPNLNTKNPSPTIKAPDIAEEEREVREEGVRREGFSCTEADTVSLHFQRSGSDSGVPLSSSALFLGILREPRAFSRAELPGTSPYPSLKRLRRAWAAPSGTGAGGGAPSSPPKPTGRAGKARFWETCGERMDVICLWKRGLKDQ